MPSGTIINSIEDFVAILLDIIESSQTEIAFMLPPSLFSVAGTFDTVPRAKRFIENGGALRGITMISPANVEEVKMRLNVGVDMRHSDQIHEVFMVVGDRKQSVSMINVGVDVFSLDTPMTAFWSESPTYAEYLLASFETAWSQAVPAEERIQKLMKQS